MSAAPSSPSLIRDVRVSALREAFWVSAPYFLLGVLWIWVSDDVVSHLTSDPAELARLSTLKGWAYVVVTTLLLFGVMTRVLLKRFSAEQMLGEAVARYSLIADHTADVIWLLDLATRRFTYVSPGVQQLRGYTADEVLSQAVADVMTPESAEQVQQALPPRLAAFVAGDPRATTQMHRVDQLHRDGRIIPTEVVTTILGDGSGRPTQLLGVTRDITERLRTQQLLEEREAILQRTSRLAKVGGWDFDVATMKGGWTEEIARIHDVDFTTDVAVSFGLDVYPGESRTRIEQAIQAAIERAEPYDLELEMITRVGRHKWVRTVGIPVVENGSVVRMVGTMQDVTDRAEAQQALRDLNQTLEDRVVQRTAELQTANRELESFSYSVSHDLRAPLRAIDGFARILDEEYGAVLNDEGQRLLGIVRQEAARMGVLIDDLLAFSRVGRRPMRQIPVDMTALARHAVAESLLAEDAGRVDVRIDALPQTVGDEALLRQVWINLVSNAVKYSRPRERAEIVIGGTSDGVEQIYYVRDNGVGFDMKYAGQLFGVFHRLHADDQFPGTGVGLALVHRIVTRHGGRVWAEAAPDAGACFYMAFPVKAS